MHFSLNTQDDAFILRIGGELDALSVDALRAVLRRIGKERPPRVLVDIYKLRLIDGSGVGAIVSLFKMVRAYNGSLAVIGACDQPLAILRLLRLDRVLAREAA